MCGVTVGYPFLQSKIFHAKQMFCSHLAALYETEPRLCSVKWEQLQKRVPAKSALKTQNEDNSDSWMLLCQICFWES